MYIQQNRFRHSLVILSLYNNEVMQSAHDEEDAAQHVIVYTIYTVSITHAVANGCLPHDLHEH